MHSTLHDSACMHAIFSLSLVLNVIETKLTTLVNSKNVCRVFKEDYFTKLKKRIVLFVCLFLWTPSF